MINRKRLVDDGNHMHAEMAFYVTTVGKIQHNGWTLDTNARKMDLDL
jgi:hypothetical protein